MDETDEKPQQVVTNSGNKTLLDGIDTDLKLKVGETGLDVDTEHSLVNVLVTADDDVLDETKDIPSASEDSVQKKEIQNEEAEQISDTMKSSGIPCEDGVSTLEQRDVDNISVDLKTGDNTTQHQGTKLSSAGKTALQIEDSDNSKSMQDVEMSTNIVDSKDLANVNTDSNSICDGEICNAEIVQGKQSDNDNEAQNIQPEDECNIEEKSMEVENVAVDTETGANGENLQSEVDSDGQDKNTEANNIENIAVSATGSVRDINFEKHDMDNLAALQVNGTDASNIADKHDEDSNLNLVEAQSEIPLMKKSDDFNVTEDVINKIDEDDLLTENIASMEFKPNEEFRSKIDEEVDDAMETEQPEAEVTNTISTSIESMIMVKTESEKNETNSGDKGSLGEDITDSLAQSDNTEEISVLQIKDVKVECETEGKTEEGNKLEEVSSVENAMDSAAVNLETTVQTDGGIIESATGAREKEPVSMEIDASESGDNMVEKKDNQDADDIKIIDFVTPNDKPKEIINLDDDEEEDTTVDGKSKDGEASSITSEKQIAKDKETGSKTEEAKNSQQSTPQGKTGGTPSKIQNCIVCARVGKCKYNIVRNGDIKHLCDDVCFKRFRSSPTTFLRAASVMKNQEKSASVPKTPPVVPSHTLANDKQADVNKIKNVVPPPQLPFKTCSVCQLMNVNTSKPFLNWLGLDFCREECLGKFQSDLNNTCTFCAGSIATANKAKFCSKIGNEVKNFCSTACNTVFKKRQKVCSFCQKDLASAPNSFMAPAGPQATFKDFCTQTCLQNYEQKSSKDSEVTGLDRALKSKTVPEGDFTCAVCSKTGPAKHEIKLEGKMHRLCSDPCLSAFQYANKLTMDTCDNCGVYCYCEGTQAQYIQYEGHQKRFCSFMCINTFKSLNKKVISCTWCGSKKSNFEMIERVDQNNKYQLFCSLNCLSLYRVNLQATSNQAVTCDQCRKCVPAQYHLTMSDASVRNFCSYNCVMAFQGQFASGSKSGTQEKRPPPQKPPVSTQPKKVAPQRLQTVIQQKTVPQVQIQQRAPLPPAQPKMLPSAPIKYGTRSSTRQAQQVQTPKSTISFPVISNVVSLAPQTKAGILQPQTVNFKSTTPVPVIVSSQSQTLKTIAPITSQSAAQQQIIIRPPPPKSVKNKSLLCKPFVQTKATSCRPLTQTKSVQTDGDSEPKKYFIPVPVPIYVPVPMAMYAMPTPFPLPVAIPIGIPCFIPTTRKSLKGISKSIKEILDKIPSDPLEAELLMMAEAVASVPKKSDSDSSDEDDGEEETSAALDTAADEDMPQSETAQEGSEFGDDMLQMALRMASQMNSQPVMDLETSLEPVPVNTDPPLKPALTVATPSPAESDEDYIPTRETKLKGRGTKRQPSGRGRKSKRPRVETKPVIKEETPPPPSPPTSAEPLDAHMCLKYTYGVNAWKHWVVHKNTQVEKVSKSGSNKLKLFKTELLQCSADELNYSLCLFVKEVCKPNGEEYAADSIFYLCLGIQSYIFENGRVDNIFTDMYYEKFTECLNDVLARYEPRINTSGQLVCRIEEEQLWESKQLGAHSPHVLLNTLVYFNTKYFMLKSTDDHMKLSFTHIMKHFKKSTTGKGVGPNAGRSVFLRFLCSNNKVVDNFGKKKNEEMPVYEQAENLDNPLRCPVKLYEFYLSKCPDSTKNRNDTFYMAPERSCVPDSPVWYSTQPLINEAMTKMLNRIRLVREIQDAHLHTQPIYM